MNIDTLYGAIAGVGGATALEFVRYLLMRRDKQRDLEERRKEREKDELDQARLRQEAIDTNNVKLAAQLRDEMRRDNADLRGRLEAAEKRIEELAKSNNALLDENSRLKDENDAQGLKIARLEGENATQTLKITKLAGDVVTLEGKVKQLQAENDALVAALKAADIPIPESVKGKTNGQT